MLTGLPNYITDIFVARKTLWLKFILVGAPVVDMTSQEDLAALPRSTMVASSVFLASVVNPPALAPTTHDPALQRSPGRGTCRASPRT